ncbi:MAG: hypothetical protein ACRYFS_24850 [Janthinobacterium lividum]
MMQGTFRDEHPRIVLSLPGMQDRLDVEFIVDTGFAGDLSLPIRLINQTEVTLMGFRDRRLATGQEFRCPYCSIMLEWDGEVRLTEVLVLEGDPLLGTVLLREYLILVEMTDGGEISIEPL